MVTLTVAEARRLFNLRTRATHDQEHHQRWSDWRRTHQATARRCHYNRRLKDPRLSL